MNLRLHLQIVGSLLLVLAAAHAPFGRYFGWKRELAVLSLLTRQVFWVHTFFIALMVALMGWLSAFCADDLLAPSRLSRAVLGGIVLFWGCRLAIQLFVYDAAIWRGRRFYTFMHIVFLILWIYVVVTYGAAWHRVWAVGATAAG